MGNVPIPYGTVVKIVLFEASKSNITITISYLGFEKALPLKEFKLKFKTVDGKIPKYKENKRRYTKNVAKE